MEYKTIDVQKENNIITIFLNRPDVHNAMDETLMKEGTPELFEDIKRVLSEYKNDIYLPVDFAVENEGLRKELSTEELPTDRGLFDIGQKTMEKYMELLESAKTVFLSGPCGVFENPLFQLGTKQIFNFVANSNSFSIIGGGHTVAAVEQLKLRDRMSHISSGGGSLEKFMMGEPLVVVEALKQAKKQMVQA